MRPLLAWHPHRIRPRDHLMTLLEYHQATDQHVQSETFIFAYEKYKAYL